MKAQVPATGRNSRIISMAAQVMTDFAECRLNIRVVFDRDNRVAGLWFQPAE
jgi:hypothetical protein